MIRRLAKFIVRTVQIGGMTIISGLKVLIFSRRPENLRTLRPLGATECVILGNGPSLKDSLREHHDRLRGKRALCMNDFADSEDFFSIKPDYYIFTDPTYWAPDASERFCQTFRRYNQTLERVDWPLTIFLPLAAKGWNFFQDLPTRNRNIRICYFNSTEVNCPTGLRFWFYRRNLAIPPMQNVLVAGIFVSLNMGFDRIFVLGGDHSWHEKLHVDGQNRLFIKNDRFQDKEESTLSPFFEDPGESEPYRMSNLFRAFSRMYYGYEELEAYATSIGAKIYNASKKSYIDAFERYRLEKTDAERAPL